MTKPMIRIHNATTDEVIDREMTDEEFAQWEIDQINFKKMADEELAMKAKKSAAEAKLAALGLTTDDLKALGLN
jgi:purine-nucleoside phosphorylase